MLSPSRGIQQVDPDYERASVCQVGLAGADHDRAFAPEAMYELKIDTNGDNVADIAYRVRFTSSEGRDADRDASPG